MSTKNVVFLIDIENGFACPTLTREQGGCLYVPEGEQVGAPAAALIDSLSDTVFVLSQDYHPANHISFAVNHKGLSEGSEILLKIGSEGRYEVAVDSSEKTVTQRLWTVHCVQGTESCLFVPEIMAALPPRLVDYLLMHDREPLLGAEGPRGNKFYVVRKGMRCDLDSYGISTENDGVSKTKAPELFRSLAESLAREGVRKVKVSIGGLATNFCAEFSHRDVYSDFAPILAEKGIAASVTFLSDISRGVPLSVPGGLWPDNDTAMKRMTEMGSHIATSRDVVRNHLMGRALKVAAAQQTLS